MENNKKFKVIPQEIKEQILGRIDNDGVTVAQASTDHGISTKRLSEKSSPRLIAVP